MLCTGENKMTKIYIMLLFNIFTIPLMSNNLENTWTVSLLKGISNYHYFYTDIECNEFNFSIYKDPGFYFSFGSLKNIENGQHEIGSDEIINIDNKFTTEYLIFKYIKNKKYFGYSIGIYMSYLGRDYWGNNGERISKFLPFLPLGSINIGIINRIHLKFAFMDDINFLTYIDDLEPSLSLVSMLNSRRLKIQLGVDRLNSISTYHFKIDCLIFRKVILKLQGIKHVKIEDDSELDKSFGLRFGLGLILSANNSIERME